MLSSPGISKTASSRKPPWRMAESFVAARALMFAELRTMTCVIGKPPIRPDSVLPAPWANSSRLGGVTRFWGSSLSVASRQSSVSRLPTTAMVAAMTQTRGSLSALHAGDVMAPCSFSIESRTGTVTSGALELVNHW